MIRHEIVASTRHLLLGATLSLAAAALSLTTGCAGPGDDPEAISSFSISATPSLVPFDQDTTQLIIIARQDGVPGQGVVTLSTARGSLAEFGLSTTITLVNGAANINYHCDRATDPACTGRQLINGKWNGKTALGIIEFLSEHGSGDPDGGVDGGDTGVDGGDAGKDTGDTGNGEDAPLSLVAAKQSVCVGLGERVDLEAKLTDGAAGAAVAGATLTFTTDKGAFVSEDGNVESVQTVTGSDGLATAVWVSDGMESGDVATITVSDAAGNSDSVQINAADVKGISWVKTSCGADSSCVLMGVKRSGYHETAEFQFKIVNNADKPVAGIPVTFGLLPQMFSGVTVNSSAISDAQGIVKALVATGSTVGSFTVEARIEALGLSATSPAMGITGSKPTNGGNLRLTCEKYTLPVLETNSPPAAYTTKCTVEVTDRYQNPVGTGTTVKFWAEAGTIPATAQLKAFDPRNPTDVNVGKATVEFRTTPNLPGDFAPLPADPDQYPVPREAEPSVFEGGQVKNPRDMFVTIMVSIAGGEEKFIDANANGTWDEGEQFFDQGEPFVDMNDDNKHDSFEEFDDADADGVWDKPSGFWDANTTIWTQTRVLYSGYVTPSSLVETDYSHGEAIGATTIGSSAQFGTVGVGSTKDIYVVLVDKFLNRLAPTSSLAVKKTGQKGTISLVTNLIAENGYGFGWVLQLVDATDYSKPCNIEGITTPICAEIGIFGKKGTSAAPWIPTFATARVEAPKTTSGTGGIEANTVELTVTQGTLKTTFAIGSGQVQY